MTPCSSGNSPTISVTRSALQSKAARSASTGSAPIFSAIFFASCRILSTRLRSVPSFRFEIGDEQKPWQKFAGLPVAQWYVFLVLLHRQNQTLGRHFQKLLAKCAFVNSGPFDQCRDFIEQCVVGDELLTFLHDFRECLDDCLPALRELRLDLANGAQRVLVILRMLERNRFGAEKSVPERPVGTRDPEHFAGNQFRPMHHQEAVYRSNELRVATTPPHDLGDRKFSERIFNDEVQTTHEIAARCERSIDEHLALGRILAFEFADVHTLLLREAKQRRRRLSLWVEGDFDAGTIEFDELIRSLG